MPSCPHALVVFSSQDGLACVEDGDDVPGRPSPELFVVETLFTPLSEETFPVPPAAIFAGPADGTGGGGSAFVGGSGKAAVKALATTSNATGRVIDVTISPASRNVTPG